MSNKNSGQKVRNRVPPTPSSSIPSSYAQARNVSIDTTLQKVNNTANIRKRKVNDDDFDGLQLNSPRIDTQPLPSRKTENLKTQENLKNTNSTYHQDRKAAKESKRFDVKKIYKSRRTKNFMDNDSNGEDGSKMDTAVITYKDS